jgi:hypothetical protein
VVAVVTTAGLPAWRPWEPGARAAPHTGARGIEHPSPAPAAHRSSAPETLPRDDDLARTVRQELTKAGWSEGAARSVTQLNAEWLAILRGAPGGSPYRKTLGLLKRLGGFRHLMPLLERRPETAGLLASQADHAEGIFSQTTREEGCGGRQRARVLSSSYMEDLRSGIHEVRGARRGRTQGGHASAAAGPRDCHEMKDGKGEKMTRNNTVNFGPKREAESCRPARGRS